MKTGKVASEVIEQARAGCQHSQEEVIGLLSNRLLVTARWYSRQTWLETEDLLQEMRLGVLIGLQQVDLKIGDPLCYLYLRGKWRALAAIRQSNPKWAEELTDSLIDPRPPFEAQVVDQVTVESMLQAHQGPRRTILLGLLAGHSQDELAKQLGCTPANISYHVRQIRRDYQKYAAKTNQV